MLHRENKETTYEKLSLKEVYAPKIFIVDDVAIQMAAYTKETDIEVAWLLFVKEHLNEDTNEYIIYDTMLLEQECSATNADLTEEGLQTCLQKIIEENRTDEVDNIRGWGHSHVNMSVTPSKTDDDTFEEYYNKCSYFIRLITNKKGETRIDFIDREKEIKFESLEWKIKYTNEQEGLQKLYYEHINAINEIETKLEKLLEDKYEKIKEKTKKQIEKNTKKTTYDNIYKTKYWKGYEDYEIADFETKVMWPPNMGNSEYYPMYPHEEYDENEMPSIEEMNKKCIYKEIDEVLTLEEISELSWSAFPKEISTIDYLKYYYTDTDWEKLIQTAEKYVEAYNVYDVCYYDKYTYI